MARHPVVLGGPAAQDLVVAADADRLPPVVLVSGPGGSGRSWLLERCAGALRAAGRAVVFPGQEPRSVTARFTALVDDAHLLDPGGADLVRAALARPRGGLVLTERPGVATTAWRRLRAALPGDVVLVQLGHLPAGEVARWAAATGRAAGADDVAALVAGTGGLPALLDRLPDRPPDPADDGRPWAGSARQWVDREVAALPPLARTVLALVAAGCPWDEPLLARVLAVPSVQVQSAVAAAWASGLVPPDGAPVPVTVEALAQALPPSRTSAARRALLAELHSQGRPTADLARSVSADGADPTAARVLVELARSLAHRAPAEALDLLGAVDPAGGGPTAAGVRAAAAVSAGRPGGALADAQLAVAGGDRAATDLAAALLHAHGLSGRAGGLLGEAADGRGGAAALALLAGGHAAAAARALGRDPAAPGQAGRAAEQAVAEAVLAGLAGAPARTVLGRLVRAQAAAPTDDGSALLDSPAAVGALVALHLGEPAAARSLVAAARRAGTGGALLRTRHRLLAGWADAAGDRAAARPTAAPGGPAPGRDEVLPRDELCAAALAVVLAGEDDRDAALARADRALLAHPVDLWSLGWVGELRRAAAAAGRTDALRTEVARGDALLARLGHPPDWSLPWHWSGLRAALLGGDPAATGPPAAALARLGTPRARAVLTAGRVWLDVLAGRPDPADAVAAVDALAAAGFARDAADLAAQAATATGARSGRAPLLARARRLATTDLAPAPGSRLTARETEVARLVVAGCTHAEVGARLFLSPRTVEHHVARLRHRLGAGRRSELLDLLRAELAG